MAEMHRPHHGEPGERNGVSIFDIRDTRNFKKVGNFMLKTKYVTGSIRF
jgi:hypothetical protein